MATGNNYNLHTNIGKLRFSQVKTICNRLLLNDNWRRLAQVVKHRDGSPMYSFIDIELLGRPQPGTNPANDLFRALSSCYTLGMLISAFKELELYWLADFLAVDILGGPSVQPAHSPGPHPPPPQQAMPTQYSSQPTVHGLLLHNSTGRVQETPFVFPTNFAQNPNIPYSTLAKLTNNFDRTAKHKGGHLIGSGGSSEVFYARDSQGKELAIKRFNQDLPLAKTHFMNELQLLPGLNHENVLPLLASSSDDPSFLCLVYPYMPKGSLMDRLSTQIPNEILLIEARMSIVIELAQVLKYLHDNAYVHRDVKSANVLLDDSLMAKLGDFGIARHHPDLVDEQDFHTMVTEGSLGYIAPEGLEQRISSKLDVFSFGVILLEIITGKKAYDFERDIDERLLYNYVPSDFDEFLEGGFVDRRGGYWGQDTLYGLFTLAVQCLHRRRDRRPSMEEVLRRLQESYA